jgi:hypothetical protein
LNVYIYIYIILDSVNLSDDELFHGLDFILLYFTAYMVLWQHVYIVEFVKFNLNREMERMGVYFLKKM